MNDSPITARKYTYFADMKANEYRYWQSRPAHERLDAVEEMIETAYALKGWTIEPKCTETTNSSKRTTRTQRLPMPRLPTSAHHSKVLARKISLSGPSQQ